jgi:NitT/TauT family transport system ATP-binding protein
MTQQMQATPKLQAKALSKRFTKRGETLEVLRDINFSVREGEFVAILGASGCGKTTLLRIVDGLTSTSAGEILVDGQPRVKPGPDRGFVFQQDTLLPWRTVLNNVSFGLEVQGTRKKQRHSRAREYIRLVGLEGFDNHYPHELSGGMRQRANLARAFAINPEILLMDEPFAALDAQTREIMQIELLRIWEEARRTVLFITHQIDEAILLADRVIVLTARPGTIKEVIDIDFPRPRPLNLKRKPEFVDLVDHIWQLIEVEVQAAVKMAAV